jgi:CubicO group peptidase (beta-lactamase class C family)
LKPKHIVGALALFSLTAPLCAATSPVLRQQPGSTEAAQTPPRHIDIIEGPIGQAVDAILTTEAARGFGGTVVVVVAGEVVLQGGYGFADRDRRLPYTAHTPHEIGSISKVFTAMALFDLEARGLVDLSKPVSAYLPTAAQPAASLTLDQLLRHRGGMVEYCGSDNERGTKADLLTRCMAAPLISRPGGESRYSNPGFSVLAAVVEQVSGTSLNEYLTKRMLRPLGLDRTGYIGAGADTSEIARSYLGGRPQPLSSAQTALGERWQVYGNGGMISTAVDMFHFQLALAGTIPMKAAVRGRMVTPPSGSQPRQVERYGFGITADDQGKPHSVSHGGSNGSFASSFYWRPQERAFIYMSGNSGEDDVVRVIRLVRTAVLPSVPAAP